MSTTLEQSETSSAPKPRVSTLEKSSRWAAVAFLLPNFLGFLTFTLFPVVFSFYMALTNWTLKPGVEREFLGSRNFVDLLGVRPIEASSPGVLIGYLIAAMLVVLGIVGVLVANASNWRGTKWGGLAILLLGWATLTVAVTSGAGQGNYLAGGLFLLMGGAATFRPLGDWKLGRGVIPGVMVLVGSVGLWALGGRMWQVYELWDSRFWQYFYNTGYLMIGIPFGIAGSLVLALLLNNEFERRESARQFAMVGLCGVLGVVTFFVVWNLGSPNLALVGLVMWIIAGLGMAFNVLAFRTIFFLPSFTAGVALLILWKAMYNPETGPINVMIESMGGFFGLNIQGPEWLASVEWAKPALIIMGVWTGIGGTNMLLYLAGLSNVQQELIDAADVDGANGWQRFGNVIWPQLAPTTFFITIMSIIGGLQGGFEQARVMTGGGPAGSTTTLAYYIYTTMFEDLDLGYAAAISWVLFAIIFVATAINWRYGRDLEVE